MNLLSKFDCVEIRNDSLIDEKDKQLCETEQLEYNKAVRVLDKINNILKVELDLDLKTDYFKQKSNNKYLTNRTFEKINDIREEKTNCFISSIISYFARKYKVELDEYDFIEYFKNELKEKNAISYNDIIGWIFIQLNGMGFAEKAIAETKEKTRSIYYYNEYKKTSNMFLNGTKLTINGNYTRCSYCNKYYLDDRCISLFNSLYLFDSGSLCDGGTELHFRYLEYGESCRNNTFLKYETKALNKLKSIKFFKNGKVKMTFSSQRYAREFAIDYCGYNEGNEVD